MSSSVFAKAPNSSLIPIEPMDGMSYGYSATDPSPNGRYGSKTLTTAKGDTGIEVFLANATASACLAGFVAMCPALGESFWYAVATHVASYVLQTNGDRLHVYYRLYTQRNTQLPGFYQKLTYVWYSDKNCTVPLNIPATSFYRFKA